MVEEQITAIGGSCPLAISDHKEIVLAHGSGERLTQQLIQKIVLPQFRNDLLLGLDPLYVANEGKLLAIISSHDADSVLSAMRAHPLGEHAAIIGEVVGEHAGMVTMKTRVAGTRIVDMLSGEQLPRIC